MEEILLKLGFSAYQIGGIIGLLVLFVSVLVFLLMTFYARRIKAQTTELDGARKDARDVRELMSAQMARLLTECENDCNKKDMIVDQQRQELERLRVENNTYRNNETYFKNEILNLQGQLNELPKTRRPKRQ